MESLTERVWNRLAAVRSLSFIARSGSSEPTGWGGQADGQVKVKRQSSDRMLFIESGSRRTPEGRVFGFTNTYQWTRETDRIQLEHLRFGAERSVYLFDLVPDGADHMVSHTPHVCSDDLYSATLYLAEDIRLKWTVVGPNLNETIEYRYGEGTLESEQNGSANPLPISS